MEQQYQNSQVEEGISLIDIVRLLLSKIKLLIVVVLIGGILGGAFAVWKTIDVNEFGTKVEFYVNPEKPAESTGTNAGTAAGGSQYGVYGAYGRHVMDNMIKLLGSDSFAEKLLLNGEPLPDMSTQWFDEDAETKDGVLKNVALQKAVDEAMPYIDDVNTAEEGYNNTLEDKAAAVKAYTEKENALNSLWKTLYRAGDIVTNSTYFTEKAYGELTSRPDELEQAYLDFGAAQDEVSQKTTAALNAEEAWRTMKNKAFNGDKSPVEKALNIWRTSSLYESKLSFYKKSVSYSYLANDDDFEDANNLARSFIYVKISVQNSSFEKGLADGAMLLERVKKVVPQYVSENMTIPDGYSGTNCQRITRVDDVALTNPLYTTTQAIKYAVLMAAVAFVMACVILIILDKSDKRLRDPELIGRKFNVPLLGIVPTIEDLKIDQQGKKKTDKTSEVK